MAFGALFAVAQERRRNLLARIALNNMTQALCMYDAAGRLVLCNMRFIEMYKLQREQLRGGMPMRDLLALGVAAGTFGGDPGPSRRRTHPQGGRRRRSTPRRSK